MAEEKSAARDRVERIRELTLGDEVCELSPVWGGGRWAFYEIALPDGHVFRVSVEEIE